MLQVTLRLDGGEKEFTQDFISGRAFRRAVELQAELKDGVDVGALDKMVGYVVDLFGKQFTADQFYDGIAANKLISTVIGCIRAVTSQASQAIGSSGEADPN